MSLSPIIWKFHGSGKTTRSHICPQREILGFSTPRRSPKKAPFKATWDPNIRANDERRRVIGFILMLMSIIYVYIYMYMDSRELTYPTWDKAKSSTQKVLAGRGIC